MEVGGEGADFSLDESNTEQPIEVSTEGSMMDHVTSAVIGEITGRSLGIYLRTQDVKDIRKTIKEQGVGSLLTKKHLHHGARKAAAVAGTLATGGMLWQQDFEKIGASYKAGGYKALLGKKNMKQMATAVGANAAWLGSFGAISRGDFEKAVETKSVMSGLRNMNLYNVAIAGAVAATMPAGGVGGAAVWAAGSLARRLAPNVTAKDADNAIRKVAGKGKGALKNFYNDQKEKSNALVGGLLQKFEIPALEKGGELGKELAGILQDKAEEKGIPMQEAPEGERGQEPPKEKPESPKTDPTQTPKSSLDANRAKARREKQSAVAGAPSISKQEKPANKKAMEGKSVNARFAEDSAKRKKAHNEAVASSMKPMGEILSIRSKKDDEQEEKEGDEKEEPGKKEQEEMGMAQKAAFKLLNNKKLRAQRKREEEEKKKLSSRIRDKVRSKIRKIASQVMRRAVNFIIGAIASLIGVGTAGIGFIVTGFMAMLTLGDLNLQMIWGYYVSKKKSWLFPPLEWDPLPVKNILPDKYLHGALVVVDIVVAATLVMAIMIFIVMVMIVPIIMGGAFIAIDTYFGDPAFKAIVDQMMAGIIPF